MGLIKNIFRYYEHYTRFEKLNDSISTISIKNKHNSKFDFENKKTSYFQQQKKKNKIQRKLKSLRKALAYAPQKKRKFNFLGIASLISLFVGVLFVASIPLAIIAISQFMRHPEKYKGIWAPITALILSVIAITVYISMLLLFGLYSGPIGVLIAVATVIALIAIAAILYLSLY